MDGDSGVALPAPRSDLVDAAASWAGARRRRSRSARGAWTGSSRRACRGSRRPGCVPGIVGALIDRAAALVIVVRALRARRARAPAGDAAACRRRRDAPTERFVRSCSLALCFAFAAGLVGHGVPFWLGCRRSSSLRTSSCSSYRERQARGASRSAARSSPRSSRSAPPSRSASCSRKSSSCGFPSATRDVRRPLRARALAARVRELLAARLCARRRRCSASSSAACRGSRRRWASR